MAGSLLRFRQYAIEAECIALLSPPPGRQGPFPAPATGAGHVSLFGHRIHRGVRLLPLAEDPSADQVQAVRRQQPPLRPDLLREAPPVPLVRRLRAARPARSTPVPRVLVV